MQMQISQVTQISTGDKSNNNAHKNLPKAVEIQNWIISYLAELLEVDQEAIDITIPFDRYGLDSSAAIELSGDLEDWLGRELVPTLLYDYPTVEALAKHLSEECQA